MFPNGEPINLPNVQVRSANFPGARLAPSQSSRTLYLSGITAKLPDGTFAGVREAQDGNVSVDVVEQTEQAINNLEAVVKKAAPNGGLENVVDVTIYLVDCQLNFTAMNSVWNRRFPDFNAAPARATIDVSELGSPKVAVELKCVALVPGNVISKF